MLSRQFCVWCSVPSRWDTRLPVAVDDADFLSNLLLGLGSGATGVSLSIHVTLEVLLAMMILLVCLCCLSPSFGHFSISRQPTPHLSPHSFRSNLYAPRGATLFEHVLLQMARAGWELDLHELLAGPLSTCCLSISKALPTTLLMASLPQLQYGSNLLISRALHTPSASAMKQSALLFRIPSQIPNLYLGFILFMGSVELRFASTLSPNKTNSCYNFLPCTLSNPVATFLTPG